MTERVLLQDLALLKPGKVRKRALSTVIMTVLIVLLHPANAGVCNPGDTATSAWVGFDNTGSTTACGGGMYNEGCADTNGGTTSTCQQCPQGFSCTASVKTKCSAGTWSALGGGSCSSCPAGMYCDPTQTPKRCPVGFYDSGNTCALAPASTYVNSLITAATALTAGKQYWASPGSWIQNQVPPGYKLITSGDKPIACAKGYSFSDTTMLCTLCPTGYYCPDPQSDQIACVNGYYQDKTGQLQCESCPTGYSCATPASSPDACADGTFSLGYQTVCTACPAGYMCPNHGLAPILCPAGTASVASEMICTALVGSGAQTSLMLKTQTTTCTAGTYYYYEPFYGRVICRSCPLGFKCPTAGAAPIQCTSGQYSATSVTSAPTNLPAGAAACQTCAVNYYCPLTTVAQIPCPTGFTQPLTGQTSCKPDPTTATCTAGQFAYPNPQTCLSCPIGFACPDVYAPPIRCIQGFYSNVGAQWCTPCELGYECPTPYFTDRAACAASEYSRSLMSQNCPLIPSRMAIASTTVEPTWCDQGSYSNLGTTTCTVCPVDKICPGDNLAPYTCLTNPTSGGSSSGTYGWTSRATELQCYPQKLSWPTSQSLNPGSNNWDKTINPGKLGMEGQATSDNPDCPPGHECLFPMMMNWVSCPPGTMSTTTNFGCQPCPEGVVCPLRQSQYYTSTGANGGRVTQGFFSPYGVHNEIVVPAGYFSDSAHNYMLRPCPAGKFTPDGTDFQAGTTGTYTMNSVTDTDCTVCPIGKVCQFQSNQPIDCAEGRSSTSINTFVCTPCSVNNYVKLGVCTPTPEGSFSFAPMMDAEKCRFGFYSSSTTITNGGQDCQPLSGTYVTSSGSTVVGTTCDVGSFCLSTSPYSGQKGIVPCPAGFYSSAVAGQNFLSGACTICTAGNFCNGGNSGQQACPPGYWCPQGTKFSTQFPCIYGTYNPNPGGTAMPVCIACPTGQLCPQGSMTSYACPAGQNCDSFSVGGCVDGTYNDGVVSGCTSCPANSFCPAGSVYPRLCPAGTQPDATTGKKTLQDCDPCPAGSVCARYGVTTLPADYPAQSGYVYPVFTQFRQQIPCPGGTYDNTSGGLVGVSLCTACPSGFACPAGTGTSATGLVYLKCEPGFYCPLGTSSTRQFPCPAGTFSASQTLTQSSDCSQCTAGNFCPPGSNRERRCPVGFYCLAGATTLTPCPSGKYTQFQGTATLAACLDCPPGDYCLAGHPVPFLCPIGSFSTGGSTTSSCTPCTAGSQCPNQGMPAAWTCPIGTYSPAGAQTCTTCRASYTCTAAGTSETTYEASTCVGYQCVLNALNTQYQAVVCPIGYYCPAYAMQSIPCPIGTYRDTTGATLLSDCLPATAGLWNSLTGQSLTAISDNFCDPGYICPAGSTSSKQQGCPPGTYSGSKGQSVCADCPVGFYCLGLTANPIPCPAGYWCAIKTTKPTMCAAGTYGAAVKLTTASACISCPKGMYCAEPGASAPTGMCNAGFICTGGSITPVPTTTGGAVCPAGGYCEIGSWRVKDCKAGFYNPNTGQKTYFQCTKCTPGAYCSGTSLTTTTGPCIAGYYCNAQSTVSDQIPAPPGSYTPPLAAGALVGATAPTSCLAGTYNILYKQSSCFPCKAGFYCNVKGMSTDIINCPAGNYCIAGQEAPTPCPLGTYNPVINAQSLAWCLPCKPGYFCSQTGMSSAVNMCSAGYFCQSSAQSGLPSLESVVAPAIPRWGKCVEGEWCPQGTAYPNKCPIGTFHASELKTVVTDCLPCTAGSYCQTIGLAAPTALCDAGFYCPQYASADAPPITLGNTTPRPDGYSNAVVAMTNCPAGSTICPGRCTAGNYCPAGSVSMQPCPAGTFTNSDFQSVCLTCPAGYYCTSGAQPLACTTGHWCPAGTGTNLGNPCDIGQYQPAIKSTFCLRCPAGSVCSTQSLAAVSGACGAGYYCTGGAQITNPTDALQGGVCQKGFFCPAGSGFPTPCSPGYACPTIGISILTTALQCTAGYYCPVGAKSITPASMSTDLGAICPAGHYCLVGTWSPQPCQPGTYRAEQGGAAQTDCLACTAGYYCEHWGTTTPVVCDEGWYCEITGSVGEVSPRPWNAAAVPTAGKYCPVGFFCTQGIKQACNTNYYQDQIGQNSCMTCPAGYLCLATAKKDCGQMNYCLAGVMLPQQCPNGYYTLNTNAQSQAECVQCPAGYTCYCDGVNSAGYCDVYNVTPTTAKLLKCAVGSYCAAGTYATVLSGLIPSCTAGNECIEATPKMVPCAPGSACTGGSTIVPCTVGYYCNGGSTTATANICQAGYTCVAASGFPYPCDLGTANANTPISPTSTCISCSTGAVQGPCNSRGMAVPSTDQTPCGAGYYCPVSTSNQIACDKGYYCAGGRITPNQQVVCATGYYTPDKYQSSCIKCIEGFYCGGNAALNGGIPQEATPCPKGNYCGKGVSFTGILKCAEGTWMPETGARYKSECFPCIGGFECTTSGIIDSTLVPCTAGFYCPAGSLTKIQCPAGAFCPVGSETYVNCPVGTYSDALGASTLTSSVTCVPCPANYACPSRGMTTASLVLCGDGFKCVLKAMSSEAFNTQGAVLCDAGSYCSRLDLGPKLCTNGYYSPNTGQTTCLGCPYGQLCTGTGLTLAATCPTTSYCPAQTSSVNNLQIVCPSGTYNPITNIGSSSDCMPCKVGHYCTGGTYADANVCDATNYCPIGQSQQSFTNVYVMGTNAGGTCPEGYTCAQGTDAPTPCPVGMYGASVKAATCSPCPGGKYCDEVALSNTVFSLKDKLCDTGYYCTLSATVSNPQPGDPTGGICPAGNYCPKGSTAPINCVAGTYEPRTGSDMCQTCPAGFYCPTACTQALECINGYCPAGSAAPTLCPDGTYSDSTLKRLAASEDCIICPNTFYCNQGLKQGVCDAGFFCDFGAISSRDTSKLCPPGHYCITAATLPTRCPVGYYYGGVGATDSTFCQPCTAGNYCIINDSVARICPRGHICPALTTEPVPCWVGTYNPWKGSSKSTDCMACPAGSDCSVRGIDDYGKYWCPTGYYCPDVGMTAPPIPCPAGTYNSIAGGANITACLPCPEGYFCQQASDWPVPCDAGYTCPQGSGKEFACTPGSFCPQLTGLPKNCPKGYYCPAYRTDIYSKCLNGTYCPDQSSYPTSCPAGYFGSGATFNVDIPSGCIGCSPGYYSDMGSNTCEMCAPGYLCTGRSTTARPLNAQQGGMPCPAGYWCPQGSYMAIACPLGTYNDKTTIPQLNMCMPCPENTFGNVYAATQCMKCLGQSKADIGSTSCKCTGLNRKYLATMGACVCQSGFMPTDGTEADKDGFSDCQKQVYQRCNTTQERDTNGICRDITDCTKQCDGGKGTIQQNFGICQCESIVTSDQLCNVDCQAKMVQTTFTADGLLMLYDPVTNRTTTAPMKNTIGKAKCSQQDVTLCKVTPVGMSSSAQGNFQGSYVIPPSIQSSVKTLVNVNLMARLVSMSYGGQRVYEVPEEDEDDTPIFANTTNTTKADPTASPPQGQIPWKYVDRTLAAAATVKPKTKTTAKKPVPKTSKTTPLTSDDSSVASYISNPVICTTIGSALLFDSLTATTYPVYDRDNLLNTNENFDYGDFQALPILLAKATVPQSFVFTFSYAGIYVFTDSRNSAKEMVIAIMDANRQCPANSNFSPMTYASLLQVGAFRKDVVTPPDWAFFFAVLISFCILVLLAVLVVAYIAKRNWQPSTIPAIVYQVFNYKQVERGDPEDKRAIVSLNTESSSFLFRSQGKEEEGHSRLELKMKGMDPDSEKKKKQLRSKKDLSLNDVEGLKDKLHKHLKEIRKLHAYNFGKKQGDGEDGAELQFSDNEESSSDDDELNRQIAQLKRMIGNTGAMLRGDGDADQIMDELIRSESGIMDPKVQMEQEEKRRLEREANAKRHREDMEKHLKDDDEKFRRKIEKENQQALLDLDHMKNKVLEMQVESAYDRGKAFQERLSRDGAKQGDLNDLMDQLEGKMQRVENLMLDDKDRQGDMLARRLEQRRNRRRAMNSKLQEVDETLMKNEADKIDLKEDIVASLQDELQEEMQQLDVEHEESKKELDARFEKEKMDRLAEFQDRLRNAKGNKNFQDILLDYQTAQLRVEDELSKQKAKEQDKLERDLKARKAKLRSQAEIKRNQLFKNLEENQGAKMDQKTLDKAKIEEALNLDEDRDAIGAQFGSLLERNLALTSKLADDMERKRRDEEALKQQQERIQRKLQVESQKDNKVADDDVENEINRIANADNFEPFQALVNERSQLQKKIAEANSEDEKQLLLRQMKEIDDAVKNQLGSEKSDQDAALKRKLEARRKKVEVAIEKERDLKNKNLSDRIDFAIQNSNDYAITKNNMTKEGLDEIVKKMKMELSSEEIPAALERIIDDKHQKELQDWLLKLYEQKAIELKEEILAMMEEKIAKIQILKKTAEDRCRGIDAIISKSDDVAQKKDYQRRKKTVTEDLEKEINMVEDDFRKREAKKVKEIQGRSMDREAVTLNQMSDLQFKEKREIFEIFLPDTLMKDIYEELGKKEHEDMEMYMRELEINKSAKLKQMDAEEEQVQAELDKKKSEVSKLSAEERKLMQKLEVEARRVKNLERQNVAVASSQDVIAMMTAQLKQGLDGLSDAYEDERRRQLTSIEAKLAERKKRLASYAEEQKILAEKARIQAEQDRLSELEKVRELRKRKAQLEVTLGKSQKLVYKQCYSRPLWTFNRKMHDANVQADNLMVLIDEQNGKFQKQVMGELLKKVTDLEDKVSTDVTAVKFKPSRKPKKGDSDTESQTSVAPVKPVGNLNLQRRFTKMLGGINPGQMI